MRIPSRKHRGARRFESGISLVELMVGTVIALIGTLIIFQVFATNEGIKRTTTSAGDAQQSGSFSAYALERHIRLAGAGFAHADRVWGCPLQVGRSDGSAMVPPTGLPTGNYPAPFDAITTALGTSVLRVAPVLVVNGANSDTIIVMAGQHESMALPLRSTSPPNTTSVALVNTVGINQASVIATDPKDLLLAVDLDPTLGVADCHIVQANDTLSSAPTTLPRPTVANPLVLAGAPFTPPSALNGYSATIQLANLGSSPAFLAFGIGSDGQTPNALLSYDLIQGAAPVGLTDNIVSLRALYGVSANATSNTVTAWVAPSGATWGASKLMDGSAASNTNLTRIRAIRLAVVARSAQFEKDDVTAANRMLFDDLPTALQVDALPANVTSTSDWQNYRYRIYDITIPLRSMLLMNNA